MVLQTTFADTGIIALSAANCLGMNLDQTLQQRYGLPTGGVFGHSDGLVDTTPARVREWGLRRLAVPTGRIAKALEAKDHIERADFRGILEEGVGDAAYVAVAGTNYLAADFVDTVFGRWAEIEKYRIL